MSRNRSDEHKKVSLMVVSGIPEPKREIGKYTETSLEVYKNAGVFFGVLQSELGFGKLSMELDESRFEFVWSFRLDGDPFVISRSFSGLRFCFAAVPMVEMAKMAAKEMRDKVRMSLPEES